LQSQLGRSFALSVRVELPDGRHTTVRVAPGEQQTVALASSTSHPGRVAALAGAAAAALLGVVLLVASTVRGRRVPRSRRSRPSPGMRL